MVDIDIWVINSVNLEDKKGRQVMRTYLFGVLLLACVIIVGGCGSTPKGESAAADEGKSGGFWSFGKKKSEPTMFGVTEEKKKVTLATIYQSIGNFFDLSKEKSEEEEMVEEKVKEITVRDVRHRMSKNLHTYSETGKMTANRISRTSITNERGMNEDMLHVFLLDRPSRGNIYQVE